jgi:hypothetical protein
MGYWLGRDLPVHPERREIYARALQLRHFVAQLHHELGQYAQAECIRSIASAMEEYALEAPTP